MRWKVQPTPKGGDRRVVRRFLWKAHRIGDEVRRFEYAAIVQEYGYNRSLYGSPFAILDLVPQWRDVEWLDKPKRSGWTAPLFTARFWATIWLAFGWIIGAHFVFAALGMNGFAMGIIEGFGAWHIYETLSAETQDVRQAYGQGITAVLAFAVSVAGVVLHLTR